MGAQLDGFGVSHALTPYSTGTSARTQRKPPTGVLRMTARAALNSRRSESTCSRMGKTQVSPFYIGCT
jgi:hypothetical protein